MATTILYIMTSSVRGLVKLGKTTPNKYDALMHRLSVDGYKNLFGLKPYYHKSVDAGSADATLLWLEKYRVGNTELYAMSAIAAKKAFNPKKAKPQFNMYKVGVKNGDTLTFVGDPKIKVRVVGEREVEYNGGMYTLSRLASKLCQDLGKKPRNTPIRGAQYFTFNGTILAQLPKNC